MAKRRPANPRKPVAPKPQPAPVVPVPPAVVVAPNQRQIPWNTILIVFMAAYITYSNFNRTPPKPPDTIYVNQAIKAVVDAATDKEAVKNLGRLYLAFGDVLSRSEPMGSSQLREWLMSSETYFVKGTDLGGSVPGFAKVKDEELTKLLTLEDKELTKDDLTKVVAFCESVAGACGVKK